jgi:hypothetical protein
MTANYNVSVKLEKTAKYGPSAIRIYTIYCRKRLVLKIFTVRFRIVNDAVLIDLGISDLNGNLRQYVKVDINKHDVSHESTESDSFGPCVFFLN